MKFEIIENDMKAYPGEYLLHTPTKKIVLCGAFQRGRGLIRALSNGQLMEDKIENFKKIVLNTEEQNKKRLNTRSCGGCKK
tara:strand:+ start:210 stop:452 length:243 start_codon:yes stop_codon:yes gene_type:complete